VDARPGRVHRGGMDPVPPPDPPVDPARSRMMAAVRGKDTRPEMLVRRRLHAAGLRFRLHRRDLPGRPDLVLTRHRTVVLVHGCFWHGHACRGGRLPRTRTAWWAAKIERNRARDHAVRASLAGLGWRVVEVWECGLRDPALVDALPALVRGADPAAFGLGQGSIVTVNDPIPSQLPTSCQISMPE